MRKRNIDKKKEALAKKLVTFHRKETKLFIKEMHFLKNSFEKVIVNPN